MSNVETARITEVIAKDSGKRYCAHHQGDAPLSEGSFVQRGNCKRWICFMCQNHSKTRPNASSERRNVRAQFA